VPSREDPRIAAQSLIKISVARRRGQSPPVIGLPWQRTIEDLFLAASLIIPLSFIGSRFFLYARFSNLSLRPL